MGILGGGGTHAAMGMRVWSQQVGILAGVGKDLPERCKRALEEAFDLQGLLLRSSPTPRAWQVYEPDGTRTEIFRTDFQNFIDDSPQPGELPASYRSVRGVHLQAAAPEPLSSWLTILRDFGCEWIIWEPWDIYCQPENREVIRGLLPLVDIFSPNLAEAQRLTGHLQPFAIARDLLTDGVSYLAIRMGKSGSLVAARDGPHTVVPAAPPQNVVDETGAGNAYCGGFLVGMAEIGDPVQAGRMGSVSASLALEQFGAVYELGGLYERAAQRLSSLKDLKHG